MLNFWTCKKKREERSSKIVFIPLTRASTASSMMEMDPFTIQFSPFCCSLWHPSMLFALCIFWDGCKKFKSSSLDFHPHSHSTWKIEIQITVACKLPWQTRHDVRNFGDVLSLSFFAQQTNLITWLNYQFDRHVTVNVTKKNHFPPNARTLNLVNSIYAFTFPTSKYQACKYICKRVFRKICKLKNQFQDQNFTFVLCGAVRSGEHVE